MKKKPFKIVAVSIVSRTNLTAETSINTARSVKRWIVTRRECRSGIGLYCPRLQHPIEFLVTTAVAHSHFSN